MQYVNSERVENILKDPPSPTEYTSHRLLFIEIYETFWGRLFQIAYNRLRDKEIAEEIVQDIFADLWERKEFENIRDLESYLSTAVKFAIIDHIRHQNAKRSFLEYHKAFLEINSSEQQILDYQDLPQLIQEGMGHLSETTRKIFWLNHFKDWKKDQIARHFQLSEKAIEYHLTKSLKVVRMYLKRISF